MGGIAGMIRFDGQQVTDIDRSRVSNLLKHRGELHSRDVPGGVLMAFGREVGVRGGVFAAVDMDADSQGFPPSFVAADHGHSPQVFNELDGDFCLALWDTNRQTLTCARDVMGIKPLYYVHQPGRFVAFASEIKALLAFREVVAKPNEHKFREYLTWVTDYVPYSVETFHETIYSVLPGHFINVNAQQVDVKAFWQLDFSPYAALPGPEAYATLFQSYFTDAINRRMQGKTRIGSHLSGGLDSSSVSCLAQSLLRQQERPSVHTFSIDTNQPSADEREYVQAVVDQWHPIHQTVQPINDVLDSVMKINRLFDRPEHFIIPSSFHLSVSLATQQAGCDSLLTGHDGDSVATTGFDFIDELVEAADWENLKTACQQFVSVPGRRVLYVDEHWDQLPQSVQLEKYVLYVIGSNLKKRFRDDSLPGFLSTFRKQKATLGLSASGLVSYATGRVMARLKAKTLLNSALSEEFKERVPVRQQQTTKDLTTGRAAGQHMPLKQVLHTTNVICNEQMNHIGEYYGHQYSFPFFDKKVVELCLATPLSVHFDQGRGRGLIRNGLAHVLPPSIVSRQTKANFVEYGTLSAQQLYQVTREQLSPPGHPIWSVVDRTHFATIVQTVFDPQLPVKKKTRFNWMLSRVIYLGLWLDTFPKV